MDSNPTTNWEVGDKTTLVIEDTAFGGEGVGRKDDFVFFVPFVLVGERVEIEITEVKKRFARAKVLQLIESSPERSSPLCPHFGECGGCQYQHMAYPAQLGLKQKQVQDILERIGHFENIQVSPTVPCPSPYYYRNRIMVRSQWNKIKQGLNIGFIRYDNRLVEHVHECAIAEPALNVQLAEVHANPPPRGGIKKMLRVVPQGWDVPHDTFFQNNTIMLPHMIEAVKSRLADSQVQFLIDAYCGVGFFSLELAGAVQQFVGVEYDRQAVAAAKRNLSARKVFNGEYLAGKTEELLPELLQKFPADQTAYILDPPRTGCVAQGLKSLREAGPKQVIYVSCHPATLARDLEILCKDGVYELVQITPLDMFPQTQHVECVADLRFRHLPPPETVETTQS